MKHASNRSTICDKNNGTHKTALYVIKTMELTQNDSICDKNNELTQNGSMICDKNNGTHTKRHRTLLEAKT